MRNPKVPKAWLMGLLAMVLLLAAACGGAAEPAATTAPKPTAAIQPAVTSAPVSTPTAAPVPAGTVSARDSITLVIPEEPQNMNSTRYWRQRLPVHYQSQSGRSPDLAVGG